ncbi:MAG: hypothetical protein ABL888_04295 [Pirellulaceae bacterium]
MCELLGLIVVLLLIFFMVVGVVQSIIFLIKLGSKDPEKTKPAMHSPVDAVHLIDALFEQGKISKANYDETRNALERQFSAHFELPPRVQQAVIHTSAPLPVSGVEVVAERAPAAGQVPRPPAVSTQTPAAQPPVSVQPSSPPPASVRPPLAAPVPAASTAAGTPAPAVASNLPWEQPEPAPRAPRTNWKELLKGFMEERNIRWGELASGILIVGSAVGLVISLRRELQNTIPYFPALLFLLLNLAIHGAGAYTLKRWKLRNTSRGLLLIGMLIVPLNFLAGVLLSSGGIDQRPLSDPVVWLAIIIGITGFGWLSWSSSTLLFRRGAWTLWLPVMVAGITTVVVNRVPLDSLGPTRVVWAIPLLLASVATMIVGGLGLLQRRAMTPKTLNRALIVLGVVTFSFLSGLSIFLFKVGEIGPILASLSTVVSVFSLTAIWAAGIVFSRVKSREQASFRMIAAALISVFSFAILISFIWTSRFPRELLIYASALGLLSGALGWIRRQYAFVLLAVVLGVIGSNAAILISRQTLPPNGMIGATEFIGSLISGRAAITWLVSGVVLACLTPLIKRRFARAPQSAADEQKLWWKSLWYQKTDTVNLLASVACCGLGSLVGLIAARVNPNDWFDATVGTTLLSAFSAAIVAMSLSGRFAGNQFRFLPAAALITLSLAALEGLMANKFVIEWLMKRFNLHSLYRLETVFAVVAIVSSLAAVTMRSRVGDSTEPERWKWWRVVVFSSAGVWIGLLGLILALLSLQLQYHVPQVWILSGLFAAVVIAAWSWRERVGGAIQVATGLAMFWAIGSQFQATADTAERITTPGHWLSQANGLAIWSLIWLCVPARFGRNAIDWLTNWRIGGNQVAFYVSMLATGLMLLWVGLGLLNPITNEIATTWSLSLNPKWEVPRLIERLSITLGAFLVVAIVGLVQNRRRQDEPVVEATPNADAEIAVAPLPVIPLTIATSWYANAAVLLILGLLAIQAGRWESDVATASALRWLMAIGGAVIAVLMWLVPRKSAKGPEGSADSGWLARDLRLDLTRIALIASIGIGLSVALVGIANFLLIGPVMIGGPLGESALGALRKDASFGIPIVVILATFLSLAISERRNLLAVSGSYVLRFLVVFQLLLLVLSPHPKLATEWFVSIVQMVSLGMTTFGLIWFAMHSRTGTVFDRARWMGALQSHTYFNGVLLVGLSALIAVRIYFDPGTNLGWVSSASGPLGILTLVLYVPLWWMVLWQGRGASLSWPITLFGFCVVSLTAAAIDRSNRFDALLPYWILTWGLVAVAASNFVLLLLQDSRKKAIEAATIDTASSRRRSFSWNQTRLYLAEMVPIIVSLLGAVAYACNGIAFSPNLFWWFFAVLSVVLFVGVVIGCWLRRDEFAFGLAGLVSLMAVEMWWFDPQGWFGRDFFYLPNLVFVGATGLSLVWLGHYLIVHRVRRIPMRRSFLLFPNGWAAFAPFWLLAFVGTARFVPSRLFVWDFTTAMLLMEVLLVAGLWNDRERFRLTGRIAFGLALIGWIARWLESRNVYDVKFTSVVWMMGVAITLCCTAVWLANWRTWRRTSAAFATPRFAAWKSTSHRWMPIVSGFLGLFIMLFSLFMVLFSDDAILRTWAGLLVPVLAGAYVFYAQATGQRWQQYVAIGLFVLGSVLLSWAPSGPEGLRANYLQLIQRAYMVFGGAVFLYGFFLVRWVRLGDSWITALKTSSIAVLALAVVSLMFFVVLEWDANQRLDTPLTLSTAEGIAVAVMAIAIAGALVAVAVLPRHDPLSLETSGRQAYVYFAQFVLALMVAHVVVALPWLLRLGIREYWPYIAMAVAFGGVGLSNLLKRRELTVLSEPLQNTMTVLPMAAALATLGVASKADSAMVMLLAGLVYGSLTLARPSIGMGLLALLFGNVALWFFFHKFPDFSIVHHPQLWLIPPALSTLVVSRIERARLGPANFKTLQFLSLAVIYVSSTSEVFIYGLGETLWSPMILALLALAGMLAGMMFKSRESMGLGVLFLLIAVAAMVANAHRRLDHVWPWWAFGITLGIIILVVFGLLEKRRNQQRQANVDTSDG